MLNNLQIKKLTSKGYPYRVADLGGPCKGLAVHISTKGHKSFHLGMRIEGKRRYWKLGDCANTPLSVARVDGLKLRKQIEYGEDPRAKPERIATVQDLVEGYIQSLRDKSAKRVKEAERTLKCDCEKTLYKKQANKVTSAMAADVIRSVVQRGSVNQATRLRAYLHAEYAWGMAADLDCTRDANGCLASITLSSLATIMMAG